MPPYGRALDLGCGSGVWRVRLAERGWQVTGIDIVSSVLRRACDRALSASVDVRFVEADATALSAAGIGAGYRLILDTGTFHGHRRATEGDGQRGRRRGRDGVAGRVRAGAKGPIAARCDPGAIEAAFSGWKITDVDVADTEPDAIAKRLKFDERFYRLRRE